MLKFKKTNYITVPRKEQDIPEGMWIKCDACGELLYKEDVVHNHYSCYKCGKYFRLSTKRRLRMVADKQSFEEWDTGLETANPLDYPGYPEKLDGLKEKLHIDEAVTTGVCTIKGEKTVIAVCDARFLMGSMGYVVGEKITRAVEKATEMKLPVIIFCCSGGARMHDADRATCGAIDGRDAVEQRRLARARSTHDANEFAAVDGKADVVERAGHVAQRAVYLFEMRDLQYRGRHVRGLHTESFLAISLRHL